jgi:alpha-ketoglutarate-dependent taurine dioxygenase
MVETWYARAHASGLDLDGVRRLVATAFASSKTLHVTGVTPTGDKLAFWRRIGEVLGRNADLIENSKTGELTETDGQWMDVRFEPDRADTFRHHNVGQPLHSDGAYVARAQAREIALFYMERQADDGGDSLFVDADTVAAYARAQYPGLHEQLFTVPICHGKGAGPSRMAPILRVERGRMKINWNYYRVLDNQGERIATLREAFRALLEEMIQERAVKSFRLDSGDAVLFRDDEVLHGRAGYAAKESGDRLLWKTYFTLSEAASQRVA